MTGESARLQRTLWAAVAASLAGDDTGIHVLLDELAREDLQVLAGATVEVVAALMSAGRDRADFLAVVRAELARTASDDSPDV